MRYYIIAGEASGDLHAANLMRALKAQDSAAEFRVWGGDLMAAAGGHLVKHYRELAFMGFYEVLANLRTILRNLRFCKEDIAQYAPDALVLVDYPGFNMRIAAWAKENSIRTFYYISPQVWAWKASRVHKIMQNVERLFVILPFEEDFYGKYGYKVDYVGHPLLDAIGQRTPNPNFRAENDLPDKPIIALLPGSRRQEIKPMLKQMLEVVDFYCKDYQFVVAAAPSVSSGFYQSIILDKKGVALVENKTYELLQHATAALVTSGTATLETALFGVPEVVCYKGNAISYAIAKRLVNIKYISLVNLILDENAVTELIQNNLNQHDLRQELAKLLHPATSLPIRQAYARLAKKLGGGGASQRVATLVIASIRGE
jgi:lipid-A-disaccharide synthase